jgi:threonine synthase
LNAVQESSGAIDMVTDDEILQAYTVVAATEGVFCEPASAASVAGVAKLHRHKALREGDTVVCTLTGHGLKDADTAISVSKQPLTVKATREDVARLLNV